VIRFILQLIGVQDADDATDISVGHADVTHADADVSFKLLTLQGLTAFFMMFGLVGFALLRENKAGNGVALIGALAAGVGTVWIIGRIFGAVKKLQSSGTIDNASAVGEQGSVYLTIHARGTGKVQVTIKGRLREMDAVSTTGEEISTGERIKVSAVNGSTLVVEKM
jgi:membrane protein implicated in regulation of membrane protease activity